MTRPFRTAALALLAGLSLAALPGCAGLVTGGPLIRPGEPTGIIEVVNSSRANIQFVAISACSASTYGLSRLPSGVTIPPGRSYRFTVSAGCWDVSAGALGSGEARQRMQVAPGGGVRYFVTGG